MAMLPLGGKLVIKQTFLQTCTTALSTGAEGSGSVGVDLVIKPWNKDRACVNDEETPGLKINTLK